MRLIFVSHTLVPGQPTSQLHSTVGLLDCCKMSARKRTKLSLQQKVEVIKANAGRSQRQLAEQFGIGKTQVQCILKRRAELMAAYEDNSSGSRKRLCYRHDHDDIDELTWCWFQRVQSLNTPVSVPMIQQQAQDYAKQLKKPDFQASNGWLQRHHQQCHTLCRERQRRPGYW